MDERHPPDLLLNDHVFEIAFHPSENIIAAGLITGAVELYGRPPIAADVAVDYTNLAFPSPSRLVPALRFRYSEEGNLHMASFTHHKKSCRAVQFSAQGSRTTSCRRRNAMRRVMSDAVRYLFCV